MPVTNLEFYPHKQPNSNSSRVESVMTVKKRLLAHNAFFSNHLSQLGKSNTINHKIKYNEIAEEEVHFFKKKTKTLISEGLKTRSTVIA